MRPKRTLALLNSLALMAMSSGFGATLLEPGRTTGASRQLPRSELFTFHSDAFVNLHHFLYRWAQAGPGAERGESGPAVDLREEDAEVFAALSEQERETWEQAVAFYGLAMIERDLLFDENMVKLRDCLVMAGNYCDGLTEADESALELLNRAMPVFRRHWWDRHNAENRAWIGDVMPRAQSFESAIGPRVAAAYGGEWPRRRLRVDVAPYANRVGGYTTSDGHITISSVEAGGEGNLGLELLFHEASHADPLERPLRRMIRDAFGAISADTPGDLWHMTIFYTAGEVTRSVLSEAGEPGYATYAETAGIWERREDNRRALAALDAHWKPALEAQGGYREAMRKVAEAWVEGEQ